MSRSRNIKPGFFRNEVLVTLPFEHRLLFIGLWTMADRSGRMEDRPMKIRMEIFPADSVDVESGLENLSRTGFISRYSVEDKQYIQIVAWDKHQNPHVKEAVSTIPAPCENGAKKVQAPEIPERAGLIPDFLNLIPDSIKKTSARKRAIPQVEKPDGVHEQTWADWNAHRKAKRAPVTQTVLAEAGREAGLAGMSLDAFLRAWCASGYQGFKADWIKPNGASNGSHSRSSAVDRVRANAIAGEAADRAKSDRCADLVGSHD